MGSSGYYGALLALSVGLVGCQAPAPVGAAADTARICLLAPAAPERGTREATIVAGMTLALEELREAGPRPLEWFEQSTGVEGAHAERALHQCIHRGAGLAVGPLFPEAVGRVGPIAARSPIALLSPIAQGSVLQQEGPAPNHIAAIAPPESGIALAVPGDAVLVHGPSPWARAIVESVVETHGNPVLGLFDQVQPSALNNTRILAVGSPQADVQAIRFRDELAGRGNELLVVNALATPAFMASGDLSETSVLLLAGPADPDFRQKFEDRFGEPPTAPAAAGYESIKRAARSAAWAESTDFRVLSRRLEADGVDPSVHPGRSQSLEDWATSGGWRFLQAAGYGLEPLLQE